VRFSTGEFVVGLTLGSLVLTSAPGCGSEPESKDKSPFRNEDAAARRVGNRR